MLRKFVKNELSKLDFLGKLHQLTVSAKEYLELEDKQNCLVEINKMQEYIENFQEIITILKVLGMHEMAQEYNEEKDLENAN